MVVIETPQGETVNFVTSNALPQTESIQNFINTSWLCVPLNVIKA